MNRKVGLIIGGVALLGVGVYFALRKRKIGFYDNIWCTDDKCSSYDTQSKVNSYMGVNFVGENGGENVGNGTGMLTLIFPKPHGLKVDEEILIEQDSGAKYEEYNGVALVVKVNNPFVITTNKARLGDTPTNGGYVYTRSLVSKLFNQ